MPHLLCRYRPVRASGCGAVPSWFRSPGSERVKGKDLSSAFRRGYISCVFVCATCPAAAPIIPSSLRPIPLFAYRPLLGPGPPPFLVDSQCLPRLQACRAGLDVMGCRPSPRGTEEGQSGGTQSRRALLSPVSGRRSGYPLLRSSFPSLTPSPSVLFWFPVEERWFVCASPTSSRSGVGETSDFRH